MTSSRIAVVTGANQGLGFALADGLAARMNSDDLVLLTGRDGARVGEAVERIGAGNVRGRVLDVRDADAIEALAREIRSEHGGVDLVFSNASARTTPDEAPADAIDALVETDNLGAIRVLRSCGRILRPGGRLLVVASSFGTLGHLPPSLRPRFDHARSLEAVEAVIADWRAAVRGGRAGAEGWPKWLNIPSKVAQVAAVRVVARDRRERDLADGTLVAAVCPGLIDTDASRPWFDDMRDAQSPAEAAVALLDLALAEDVDPGTYGELVRFGSVLSWSDEVAPEASAGSRVSRSH